MGDDDGLIIYQRMPIECQTNKKVGRVPYGTGKEFGNKVRMIVDDTPDECY